MHEPSSIHTINFLIRLQQESFLAELFCVSNRRTVRIMLAWQSLLYVHVYITRWIGFTWVASRRRWERWVPVWVVLWSHAPPTFYLLFQGYREAIPSIRLLWEWFIVVHRKGSRSRLFSNFEVWVSPCFLFFFSFHLIIQVQASVYSGSAVVQFTPQERSPCRGAGFSLSQLVKSFESGGRLVYWFRRRVL
jgi:hypothetical protein